MDKKLLLFDLDDTLLTSDKNVSQADAEAIKTCKGNGMVIGYITARARPFSNEATVLDNLPCDFIAYYNGAEVCAGDVSIESNVISYNQAIMIIRHLNEEYPNTRFGVYMEPWSWNSDSGEAWHMVTGEKVKCSFTELPDRAVQRIRVVFGENDVVSLSDYMTEDTTFFVTSDGSAIIVSNKAVKEHALIKASEWFNIPLSHVIAFGDDITDTGMLKVAGIGVAMGNARPSVKEIADFVTETNNDEGISVWINKYLL